MLRTFLALLALGGFASVGSAGELDRESAPKVPPLPAIASGATAPAGSELDKESPQSAHHWRGGWGYGHHGGYGYGYGGYGGFYRPYSVGYYGPYYGGFSGGFFYRPYYPMYAYGTGYSSFGYSSFGWYNPGWYW